MPLLSARHITLGYTHQGSLTTILQDFSLDVAEGELIGLMGPAAWENLRFCACWPGWPSL